MSLTIRIARTTSDLEALFRARHRVFVDEELYLARREGGRIYDRFDAYPTTANFIALISGRLVGAVRYVTPSAAGTPADDFYDFAELISQWKAQAGSGSMLFVEKESRSLRGVARALVRVGLTWSAIHGTTHVLAVVNPIAEHIFVRTGHERAAPPFFDEEHKVAVLPMVLRMASSRESLHREVLAASLSHRIDHVVAHVLAPDERAPVGELGGWTILVAAGQVLARGREGEMETWSSGAVREVDDGFSNGRELVARDEETMLLCFPPVERATPSVRSTARRTSGVESRP